MGLDVVVVLLPLWLGRNRLGRRRNPGVFRGFGGVGGRLALAVVFLALLGTLVTQLRGARQDHYRDDHDHHDDDDGPRGQDAGFLGVRVLDVVVLVVVLGGPEDRPREDGRRDVGLVPVFREEDGVQDFFRDEALLLGGVKDRRVVARSLVAELSRPVEGVHVPVGVVDEDLVA